MPIRVNECNMHQASQELGPGGVGGPGCLRGLVITLERTLSLQGMVGSDVSPHSPEKHGPFPSDRSEKVARVGDGGQWQK